MIGVRSFLRTRADVRDRAVGPRTDLVLEGYPCSGNVSAHAALRASNPELVIAHHLHRRRSVEEGVRRGLPTVLVLRDPLGAVTSRVGRTSVAPARALREYVRFHEPLLPLLQHVLVAPFPLVSTEPGRFVEEVDRRFGLGLAPYSGGLGPEEDAVDAVEDAVEDAVQPRTCALPDVEAAVLREGDLLAKAQRLFEAAMQAR